MIFRLDGDAAAACYSCSCALWLASLIIQHNNETSIISQVAERMMLCLGLRVGRCREKGRNSSVSRLSGGREKRRSGRSGWKSSRGSEKERGRRCRRWLRNKEFFAAFNHGLSTDFLNTSDCCCCRCCDYDRGFVFDWNVCVVVVVVVGGEGCFFCFVFSVVNAQERTSELRKPGEGAVK